MDQVTRRFGDVVALNRVDLRLEPGITAMVGPNGAGKSTFMKVATGHVRPSSGTVTAFGQSVWDNPAVMRRVGFVPEQDAFYEFMTGLEFVASLAELNGLSPAAARSAAEAELRALGLQDGLDRPIKGYSKGMRQRAKLAQALLHRPDLLFLDEPMLGCDPVARRRIQDRVVSLRNEGCTVLVASHILPEVERLTSDVAVLAGGRLVARGDARQVRDALSQVPSRVKIHCRAPRSVASDLSSWTDVHSVRILPAAVEVETPRMLSFLERVHDRHAKAWGFVGVETMDADLDSLFAYLAGDA
jgi:ABC-2 type transport system ATP-binding protein